MSRAVAYTKTPVGNLVELAEDGGRHLLTLYTAVPDSERELTETEAAEWLRMARSADGIVSAEVAS